MAERRVRGLDGLKQAFDEVRFGHDRSLNLRIGLPTASEATTRVENWIRQHQVLKSEEVLVITGRGNNSADGISVVREAAIRVFHALSRKGVVESFAEHTPGSFVVTLAPMAAMLEAGKRRSKVELPPPASPPTLVSLGRETLDALRILAERSLDTFGVRDREPFMEGEMLRLFGVLGASVPEGPEREARFRKAIAAAMHDYD